MKHYFIFTLFLILACGHEKDLSRNLPLDIVQNGIYKVATSNFELDNNKIKNIELGASSYSSGRYTKTGKKYYITDLLKNNNSIIKYQFKLENNHELYNKNAGTTIDYTGIIFHPTSKYNKNPDYKLLVYGDILPKMLKQNQSPKFPEQKKYPLVIFSHGHSQHPLAHTSFYKLLASHGYIVLALYHGDNRFTPYENKFAERLAIRCKAINKGIEYLKTNNLFKNYINFNNITSGGYSFGGSASTALLGAEFKTKSGSWSFKNNSVKQAIALSPGMGWWSDNKEITKSVKNPILVVAGEKDKTVSFDDTINSLKNMKCEKYIAGLEGQGHYINNDSQNIFNSLTLLFLDAYVNKNKESLEKLKKVKTINEVSQKLNFYKL